MEDKVRALTRALRSRGIDVEEVATICGFVSYIDGVDAIPVELLEANLPLAYEPQSDADGEKPS